MLLVGPNGAGENSLAWLGGLLGRFAVLRQLPFFSRCIIVCLYSESGMLNGKPYAESGREVDNGQGSLVLSYRDSNGSGGVEKATYPDHGRAGQPAHGALRIGAAGGALRTQAWRWRITAA